jgi:hypothetical protein
MKSIPFMLFAGCILALPLAASTITYTYTGNDFTFAQPPTYSKSDSVSGYFTLASPLGDSLVDYSFTPTIYSFTDGVQTFTNASPPSTVTFAVDTDLSGNISEWYVFLQNPDPGSTTSQTYTVETGYGSDVTALTRDFGNVPVGQAEGQGGNSFDQGSWKASSSGGGSTVPEPSNVALVGLGLLGIGLVRRKMQQRSRAVA